MKAGKKIEEIVTSILLNDKMNYLIRYRGDRFPTLVEEDNLTKSEKEACKKFDESMLNKKRKKSDNQFSESSNQEIKKVFDNDDNSNSSIKSSVFSESNKKEKKKINKIEKNKENKNKNENQKKSKNNGIKKLYEREGSLIQDIPIKILNVGLKNRDETNLYSLVRWKQPENIKLLDSVVENDRIKKEYPNLLIDYYESRIIFLDE